MKKKTIWRIHHRKRRRRSRNRSKAKQKQVFHVSLLLNARINAVKHTVAAAKIIIAVLPTSCTSICARILCVCVCVLYVSISRENLSLCVNEYYVLFFCWAFVCLFASTVCVCVCVLCVKFSSPWWFSYFTQFHFNWCIEIALTLLLHI